jgi:MerR family transcriptional regulator, light-induced transcriptional regulator
MRERIYSIKDLEVLSGIKAHTIRIWEKRYNLLEPDRTDTNIRMYSDNDLRRLLNIAFLVNHGFRISKVCEMDDAKIAHEIINLQQTTPDDETFLERMTVHMINFDGLSFTRLIKDVIEMYGFDEAVKRFFFPFFEKIGIFWQVGSIFPAQEHYISNLFRQKLIAEIDNLGPGTPDQEIMLFYLHEDEMHELSLLYYSYLARKKGFQIYYLGQNIPMDDLKRLGKMERIKYVFTVFINSIEAEELEKYLFDLREIFSNHKVLISGLQLKQHRPKIPSGFSIIESYKDFEKMVSI